MTTETQLEKIRSKVESCTACPLHEGRINTVFGAGDPKARILIIGEAPGKNEDEQGIPFVGRAGTYLEELLGYAGLERNKVFIANVVKCRPPSNRNPKVEEIQACAPFLRQQTAAIDPKFIVTLGNFATRFILKTDAGITDLRGRVHTTGRFKVFPVFHPAAAIYDRSKRTVLQEDFTRLGHLLNEE